MNNAAKKWFIGSVMVITGIFTAFNASAQADPDVVYNRAKLSYKMRKLDKALEECNQVLQIDTAHYEALLLKSMVYYDREQYDTAIVWATRSINVYNRYGEAYFERGLMNYYLNNFEAAAEDFTQAAKIEIKRSDYFHMKGLALIEIGEDYEACKAWTRALKLGVEDKLYDDIMKLKEEHCQNVTKPSRKKKK